MNSSKNEGSRSANNFDAIRLIAASLVIVTHSYTLTGSKEVDWLETVTSGALSFSHFGVAVFFSISGFLITQSAFRSKSWKDYLWRRSLRIFPGLMVVLLLTAFVLGPILTSLSFREYFSHPLTYKHLLSVLLYIKNYALPEVFSSNTVRGVNGSLWTLSYEFTLYIVVIVSFLLGALQQRHLLAVVWIAMIALRIYMGQKYFWYSYSSPYLLNQNMMYMYEWSLYFLSGMLIFLYSDNFRPNLWIAIILGLTYVLAAYSKNTELIRLLNYVAIPGILFYLCFVPSVAGSLSNIGDFSYGVYIYAFPIQQTIIHCAQQNISVGMLIVLSLLLTYPFAIASWFLIEKKSLNYKKIFSS